MAPTLHTSWLARTETTDSPAQALGQHGEDLLCDVKFLRTVLQRVQKRIGALTDVIPIMNFLPLDRPLNILCDWDVLYSCIASDSAERSAPSALRYFFSKGYLPYTIPEGAYRELIQWLFHQLGTYIGSESAMHTDNVNFFEQIFSILGLQYSKEETDLRLTLSEALQRCEPRAIHIDRLVSILENDRFIPEIPFEAEEEARTAATAVVRSKPRYWINKSGEREIDLRDREFRDKCDSTNLAIALTRCGKSIENSSQNEPSPYFLIMTSTGSVLQAEAALRSYSAQKALCATPEQVLTLDALGFGRNPHVALSLGNDILDQLNKLRTQISVQLSIVQTQGGGGEEVALQVGKIRKQLEGINESAGDLLRRGFLELEYLNGSIESTLLIQQRQRYGDRGDNTPSRSTGFIHLLDRLSAAYNRVRNLDYSAEQQAADHTTFDAFCVNLDRQLLESPYHTISFHRFFTSQHEVQYWTAQFIHQKGEVDLVRFLKASMPPDEVFMYSSITRKPDHTIALLPYNSDKNLGHGVTVFTSVGCFHLPPDLLIHQGWSQIRIYELQVLMREKLIPSRNDNLPEIRSIRINSIICDIVFELIPEEGSIFTTFTIISHYCAPSLVVKAVDYLGTRLITVDRLFECIKEIIPRKLPSLHLSV